MKLAFSLLLCKDRDTAQEVTRPFGEEQAAARRAVARAPLQM
jgi:hypothetical protein